MCGCESGIEPEFHRELFPRARKEHHCIECNKPIAPGCIYQRVSAKWDGYVSTVATCFRCWWLRKLWTERPEADVQCFPPYGALWDCIREERTDRAYKRKTRHARLLMYFMRKLACRPGWQEVTAVSSYRERFEGPWQWGWDVRIHT